jgi:hypothetical protein
LTVFGDTRAGEEAEANPVINSVVAREEGRKCTVGIRGSFSELFETVDHGEGDTLLTRLGLFPFRALCDNVPEIGMKRGAGTTRRGNVVGGARETSKETQRSCGGFEIATERLVVEGGERLTIIAAHDSVEVSAKNGKERVRFKSQFCRVLIDPMAAEETKEMTGASVKSLVAVTSNGSTIGRDKVKLASVNSSSEGRRQR